MAAASNLYIGSFAGLATPLTGLTSIITITIVRAISDDAVDRDDYRGAIAGAIASIIIGAAVWLYHWLKANDRLDAIDDDQEFRAASTSTASTSKPFWVSLGSRYSSPASGV